ncbi:Arginine decarboxylase [Gracilariopsis chorda]|uniref:Arginine decarboxylase n=1 Tax=Gracilariopsis chorda TaxID=448386 RepID=A0A2V3J148_9FLOR|nr:Arginine decarboxylase [Gracilariopsis chorda]|eukprot:PXF48131.1 Arginine decarboxylase [Gracilariopsis chorda]
MRGHPILSFHAYTPVHHHRLSIRQNCIRACALSTTNEATQFLESGKQTTDTPLISTLHDESRRVRGNFFCPGHKQGNRIHPSFRSLCEPDPLRADLPELPALDNLFSPEGVIQDAQRMAADTFTRDGSEIWQTLFLVNGSTCGIEAAVLACARPGRKLIIPRNAHQSAVHAAVLSGTIPVWVTPQYDQRNDLVHGITASDILEAFRKHGNQIDAVLIVSPTYHGVCSDTETIARIAHEFGAKLIVDEAHGAHFTFHPSLPRSATDSQADIVVQSTHKTLTAMSQAAMMHVRKASVDTRQLRSALQLVQTTSPNYLLLASLDGTRALMEERGKALMTQTIDLARDCASRIAKLEGFEVLGTNGVGMEAVNSENYLVYGLDCTRITVLLPSGMIGYDLDSYLIDQYGVYAELPAFRHLTFVLSPGTSQKDVDVLVTSLSKYKTTAVEINKPNGATRVNWEDTFKDDNSAISPRDAFFADSMTLKTEDAIGRISVDTLCPYPPGIPLIIGGERITRKHIDILRAVLEAGGSVSGAADNELSTIRVVAEEE